MNKNKYNIIMHFINLSKRKAVIHEVIYWCKRFPKITYTPIISPPLSPLQDPGGSRAGNHSFTSQQVSNQRPTTGNPHCRIDIFACCSLCQLMNWSSTLGQKNTLSHHNCHCHEGYAGNLQHTYLNKTPCPKKCLFESTMGSPLRRYG